MSIDKRLNDSINGKIPG